MRRDTDCLFKKLTKELLLKDTGVNNYSSDIYYKKMKWMELFIYSEEQNGHTRTERISRGYWNIWELDCITVIGGLEEEAFISVLTTSYLWDSIKTHRNTKAVSLC